MIKRSIFTMSRKITKKEFDDYVKSNNLFVCTNEFKEQILPKTGHWIKTKSENIWGWPVYECSECHAWLAEASLDDWKYCFRCGAKMVEPQESGETKCR